MLRLRKRYVVDENDRRVAVQLDLATFRQIEELLEDHALARAMKRALEKEKPIPLIEARKRYQKLKKRS
jgi:hypothetical protein